MIEVGQQYTPKRSTSEVVYEVLKIDNLNRIARLQLIKHPSKLLKNFIGKNYDVPFEIITRHLELLNNKTIEDML